MIQYSVNTADISSVYQWRLTHTVMQWVWLRLCTCGSPDTAACFLLSRQRSRPAESCSHRPLLPLVSGDIQGMYNKQTLLSSDAEDDTEPAELKGNMNTHLCALRSSLFTGPNDFLQLQKKQNRNIKI